MIVLIVIACIITLLLIWMGATYNKLVKLRNNVKEQWSQVDVQLKRRYDLIPNLVETVKSYSKYEGDTLEKIVNARNNVANARNIKEEMDADQLLESALQKLFVSIEAYPELKADESFKNLQDNLRETENKISYSRQFYNDTVLKYKNCIETFPAVMIAKTFGFNQEDFFIVKEDERENVKIEL